MFKPYQKCTHISERKYREILKLFSEDLSATQISNITNISRPAINRIFNNIRQLIADYCDKNSIFLVDKIEIDESYFGAKRVKRKRGRGAIEKIKVFEMLKRGDKIYTQIVSNSFATELVPIIKNDVD